MRHLIHINDLSNTEILHILQKAKQYKKGQISKTLQDKKVITTFFENSTRTLSSFEMAIKNLGGEVIRLDISRSSTSKGETLRDTAANLNAMNPHAIVIRHSKAGAGYFLTPKVSCPIINGGDGAHSHPTQALLDLMTLLEHFGSLEGKKIAIVGDIKNSRVANSNISLLPRFGAEILLVAPPHFLPSSPLPYTHHLCEAIQTCDALISLRTQTERHSLQTYGSLQDYAQDFCITKNQIKDRDLIILHPGPVHRNIDISDEVLDDPRSKVLEQVQNGVFVRMAVMDFFIHQGCPID
ncbi:aspartate carbamoyltransferase catalytic subunit [Helicobacter kayseriensis]|uniref:aspartate carbamoyltransferase catalytic subunit n=1 Tax=Helicobacter kayseriensis TaxID=2905877 RepID=UPI001E62A6F2|nr:aspartate carbamoyltransferase catalytic subunit [Helicobacter kayseriensis]MCE3046744.1 aspartate carbamoyltransferase catalytic subunit [Helicobacter kayseriensis]MCE3047954.1 aspartate carbamoyltransferase catalytic subunit [Helicobacter kayseriensis]